MGVIDAPSALRPPAWVRTAERDHRAAARSTSYPALRPMAPRAMRSRSTRSTSCVVLRRTKKAVATPANAGHRLRRHRPRYRPAAVAPAQRRRVARSTGSGSLIRVSRRAHAASGPCVDDTSYHPRRSGRVRLGWRRKQPSTPRRRAAGNVGIKRRGVAQRTRSHRAQALSRGDANPVIQVGRTLEYLCQRGMREYQEAQRRPGDHMRGPGVTEARAPVKGRELTEVVTRPEFAQDRLIICGPPPCRRRSCRSDACPASA